MIIVFRWLFGVIFVAMLCVTVVASLDRGITVAISELWPDPWFRATLADAYFGFLTVWVWIAYKETSAMSRATWFVLVMTLGNIAIAGYLLRLLFRMSPDDALDNIFMRTSNS